MNIKDQFIKLPRVSQLSGKGTIGKPGTFLNAFIFFGTEEYNCDIFLDIEEYSRNRRT
jgi:hypothetical protein